MKVPLILFHNQNLKTRCFQVRVETPYSEEPFFTETFPWHTITIDEGHRLKNENSSLCQALGRIPCPFRLLLTVRRCKLNPGLKAPGFKGST